ncbi:MAG: ATP-binding cassette domain-containing protein [Bacillota bacterium]|nr:ATP-binding cassette domain-containing protein [Bacillota bacterium]
MKEEIKNFVSKHFGLILVYILAYIFVFFLDSYALTYILKLIEGSLPSQRLIGTIIIVGLLMVGSKVLLNIFHNSLSFLIFQSRMNRLFDFTKRSLNKTYESFEDQGFTSKLRRAINFFSSDNQGYQASLAGFIELVPLFVLVVFSGYFLGRFSLFLLGLSFLINLLAFPLKDQLNDFDLLEDEDLGDIENRLEYYQSLTTDTKYAKDIRAFGLKDMILQRYRQLAGEIFEVFSSKTKLAFKVKLPLALLYIVNDGILLFDLIQNRGSLEASSLVFILSMYFLFSSSILKAFDLFGELKKNFSLYETYDDILNENLQDYSYKIDDGIFTVDFVNVWYKYPGSDDFALKDVNVSFSSAEKIGILGENGGGKSTFIKLLIGLFEPTKGQILINGKNLRGDQRLKYFASSFQGSRLFPASLRDNLLYMDPKDLNEPRIEEFLSANGIVNKDRGRGLSLDDKIGREFFPKAFTPSGGQEQLLVILRTLLSPRPMYVFDEPTSALDIEKELSFYKSLTAIKDRGYIIISHRLSVSNIVDKVIVIGSKTVEALGDSKTLKDKSPYYRKVLEISEELLGGGTYGSEH